MLQRTLGNTGLRTSILGLGAASLGNVYGHVAESEAIATVHRAFALGINVFDASPYYGSTLAETVLGKALRTLPRDQYVLMTKCGRYGEVDFDFTPARLQRSIEDSLRRLHTDHVDVLQLHDVEFGDLDHILDESLPFLRHVQRSGKARFVGMTGLPLKVFRRALEVGARLDTVLSYCHHTLFDTTLLALLPGLQAQGIGVVNASPTAMGLLTRHGPRPWHPAPAVIRDACRAADAHCRARGHDLAELAIQFACSEPGIATTICGTASPAEIEANVRALLRPPDQELLAEIRDVLLPIRGRTWIQGRAENNDAPPL